MMTVAQHFLPQRNKTIIISLHLFRTNTIRVITIDHFYIAFIEHSRYLIIIQDYMTCPNHLSSSNYYQHFSVGCKRLEKCNLSLGLICLKPTGVCYQKTKTPPPPSSPLPTKPQLPAKPVLVTHLALLTLRWSVRRWKCRLWRSTSICAAWWVTRRTTGCASLLASSARRSSTSACSGGHSRAPWPFSS